MIFVSLFGNSEYGYCKDLLYNKCFFFCFVKYKYVCFCRKIYLVINFILLR